MKCPVCGFEIEENTKKCPDCDFDNFISEFLNYIEYQDWVLNSVVPHRNVFVQHLLNSAENCNNLIEKYTIQGEAIIALGHELNKSHFDKVNMLFEMFDLEMNKIDDFTIDWLVKSVIKIDYIEHMGGLDYRDDICYTFNFTKENLSIMHSRITASLTTQREYSNISTNSRIF